MPTLISDAVDGYAIRWVNARLQFLLLQRRADSAKKYLAGLGVTAQQITAISFGAEKPKAQGHDEEAWKQNRRDDVSAQR